MPTFVDAAIADATRLGSVVTIGNFDGLHLGHQQLVRGAVSEARGRGVPAVAMTFEPHPVTWFRQRPPEDFRIQTDAERREALLAEGITHVATIRFDGQFAALGPEAFVEQVLCGELGARSVHIGHDFTFGRARAGNVELLRTLGSGCGFEVTEHAQLHVGGAAASSTRLRDALRSGDLDTFSLVAGRRYSIAEAVAPGAGRGRTIGIPTINQYPTARLLPPFGVYATTISLDGGPRRVAISNVGVRPTFAGDPRVSLETHILDGGEVGSAAHAEVHFAGWIRAERRFVSAEELVGQIRADIAEALIAHGGQTT